MVCVSLLLLIVHHLGNLHILEVIQLILQLYGVLGKNEERATELTEYNRYRELQSRLVELNQQANADPGAVAPRREWVEACQALGRQNLADMWRRAAEYCDRRQHPPMTPNAPRPSTDIKP